MNKQQAKERVAATARNFDKFTTYSKIVHGLTLYADDNGSIGIIQAGEVKNPIVSKIFELISEELQKEAIAGNVPMLEGHGTITDGKLNLNIFDPKEN